jgi:hypothetical protein
MQRTKPIIQNRRAVAPARRSPSFFSSDCQRVNNCLVSIFINGYGTPKLQWTCSPVAQWPPFLCSLRPGQIAEPVQFLLFREYLRTKIVKGLGFLGCRSSLFNPITGLRGSIRWRQMDKYFATGGRVAIFTFPECSRRHFPEIRIGSPERFPRVPPYDPQTRRRLPHG